MNLPLRRFLQALYLCLLCLQLPAMAAETVLVAAGAGYRRPIDDLAQELERSGLHVERVYGNMGQVFSQAANNAQIAVIFGDRAFLEHAPNLQFSRYLPLGQGRLVLAWPSGNTLKSAEDLSDARFKRIAVPDAQHAVYGKAATQFLERSKLGEALAGRLLTVATVPQVSAYLVSGEVDAGFLNLTDAMGIREKIGGYIDIPASQYDPIEIVGGVVAGHEQDPGVLALEKALSEPAVRSLLQRHGL